MKKWSILFVCLVLFVTSFGASVSATKKPVPNLANREYVFVMNRLDSETPYFNAVYLKFTEDKNGKVKGEWREVYNDGKRYYKVGYRSEFEFVGKKNGDMISLTSKDAPTDFPELGFFNDERRFEIDDDELIGTTSRFKVSSLKAFQDVLRPYRY